MKQNNQFVKDSSVIILAAGKSERLGFSKLSLKYDKNTTFLEHIVMEYQQFGCKEIVVVVNETGSDYLKVHDINFANNVKVVINKHPDWHRFYSLKLGVKNLSEVCSCFIHNVDNPFVNPFVLNQLIVNSEKADYLNPVYKERGGHPVLISDVIIRDILQKNENQMHIKEFLNQYSRFRNSIKDEKVLVNINTLEEYEKYFTV